MVEDSKDINDIFDDIVLSEERITKESYNEGFEVGVSQGNLEGYKLGYAKGVELGEELGRIYGTTLAYINTSKGQKVLKHLEVLKTLIENFPKTNDPEEDIIGKIQEIRTQYKKIRAMLKLTSTETPENTKDLSF